jgi:spermidine/putrescine transport system ATP-binding protein
MAILEIKNIIKKINNKNIIDNISIDINQGEFLTLLGPSGCGKTTLLRMIAGFVAPDSGDILLDGHSIIDLPPEQRPLHTIFQSYALFPHLTVAQNISFPLKMAKWKKNKIISQVNELLEDVELTEYANHYPHQLSGGQKQRIAIARSLVDRPKILLLDEPLSALDAQLREHMHAELVNLQQETGITFIYVTHDQSEALALSSRIAVMNKGKIEQLGVPSEIYSRPSNYFVADFLGKCNIIKSEIIAVNNEQIMIKTIDGMEFSLSVLPDLIANYQVGTTGYYAIRPEKTKLNRTKSNDSTMVSKNVKIASYYYYGNVTLYELQVGDQYKLEVLLPNNKAEQPNFFREGSDVFISFNPNAGTFIV